MVIAKKETRRRKISKKRLHFHQICAIIWWFGITEPIAYAPLAQMDRAQASDAWCRRFESAMVRQKKAHICLPRQCVLFSTKFAFGEWNMAPPCEIAPLWNICFATVKGRISFHIATVGSNISQFTEWIISHSAYAEYFTWNADDFMI